MNALNIMILSGSQPVAAAGLFEAEPSVMTLAVGLTLGAILLVAVLINCLWIPRARGFERPHAAAPRPADLFDQSGIGLGRLGHNGRWLQANAALCQLLDLRADELLARRLQDLIHPEDRARELPRLQGMLNGRESSWTVDLRTIRRDGSAAKVHLVLSVASGERGPIFYVAATPQAAPAPAAAASSPAPAVQSTGMSPLLLLKRAA